MSIRYGLDFLTGGVMFNLVVTGKNERKLRMR